VTQLFKTLLLPILLMLTGCAANYYNVPREVYEKKVRVLGVAPLMLDADSDIRHPDKVEVLKIIRDANRKNEKELVEILKGNGEYFSVRYLDEEPGQLLSAIVSRRERRDDAGIVYNKYFYKPDEMKRLIEKHNVDAVLLVTVSGISVLEKIYSNTFLAYLEDNYNNLIMTGQIVDPDGTLLWEYPNFRQRYINFSPLLALQYPDFEESRANMTDQVKVRNKTVAGIGRAFARSESSSANSARQVSVLYNKQFADMTALLQYFRNPFADKKPEKPSAAPAVAAPKEVVYRAPVPAPAATQPAQALPVPQAIPGKPAPREFEPARPLDPGIQLIKEPEIK
jgi:hypothetical protein